MTGALVSFAIESPSDVQRIGVPLTSITANISGALMLNWTAAHDSSGSANTDFIPAVLDSGDMMTDIPATAHAKLVDALNAYRHGMLDKPVAGHPFIGSMDCKHSQAEVISE